MIVGVIKETQPGETRVAITPDAAEDLRSMGLDVCIESGAGRLARYADSDYEEKGGEIVSTRKQVIEKADVLLQVQELTGGSFLNDGRFDDFRAGQVIIGFMEPFDSEEMLREAANQELTILSMELLPRISRAQSMDALTSQSNIGGYRAVIEAATTVPRLFPMMMTAAGTVQPAQVFVIGAGVAGLQAIATAERLGARVEAYDIRLEVREQVESLGADFVELDLETEEAEGESGYAREMDETFYAKQRERLSDVTSYSDAVITTANIPGREAPKLVSEDMVKQMKPGSVIIDLAAPNGGNCELTTPGEENEEYDVVVSGPLNLPAKVPRTASDLYARNMVALLEEFVEDGHLELDRDDEIIDAILLSHEGEQLTPHLSD